MNAVTPNMATPQTATATQAAKPLQEVNAAQGNSFAVAMRSVKDQSSQANAAPVNPTDMVTGSVGQAHATKGHGGSRGAAYQAASVNQLSTPAVSSAKTTALQLKTTTADTEDSTDNLDELRAEQTNADVDVDANGDTTKANAATVPNKDTAVELDTKAALKAALTAPTGAAIASVSAEDVQGKTVTRTAFGTVNKNVAATVETKHNKAQQGTPSTMQAQNSGDTSPVAFAVTALGNVSARPDNAQQNTADGVNAVAGSTKKGTHAATVQSAAIQPENAAANAPAQNEVGTDAATQASDLAAVAPASADRAGSFADKLEAATGSSIMAHGMSSESISTAGATFAYSLNSMSSIHAGSSKLTATESTIKAQSIDAADTAQYTPTPVRRLEVAVNDPLLGNVDVRAEMRGSALHASIAGDGSAVAAAMPQLHQFLEQQRVTVHSLNYNSTSTDFVRATSQGGASMSFSQGDSQSGSQDAQDTAQRQGSRNTSTEWHAAFTSDSPNTSSNRSIYAGVTAGAMQMPAGSTLSIHI